MGRSLVARGQHQPTRCSRETRVGAGGGDARGLTKGLRVSLRFLGEGCLRLTSALPTGRVGQRLLPHWGRDERLPPGGAVSRGLGYTGRGGRPECPGLPAASPSEPQLLRADGQDRARGPPRPGSGDPGARPAAPSLPGARHAFVRSVCVTDRGRELWVGDTFTPALQS